MNTTYSYLDFLNFKEFGARNYRSVRCTVVKEYPLTCDICLLEFGPNGKSPGTIMRKVHKKNLAVFATEQLFLNHS